MIGVIGAGTMGVGIVYVFAAAGFETAETLRFHFRQTFGTSPSAYRKRFSVAR